METDQNKDTDKLSQQQSVLISSALSKSISHLETPKQTKEIHPEPFHKHPMGFWRWQPQRWRPPMLQVEEHETCTYEYYPQSDPVAYDIRSRVFEHV